MWLLSAIVFGVLAVNAVLGGDFYPISLGGDASLTGPVALLAGAAAAIAAWIAFLLRAWRDRAAVGAFAIWLGLAVLGAVVSSPLFWLTTLGVSGLLAMAVAWPELRPALRPR